jgi:hypothetical protein
LLLVVALLIGQMRRASMLANTLEGEL